MDLLFTKYLRAKIIYENITRIETYPYPKLAIREAVFNALVHNNYSLGIPIQISVYSDKLYIGNDTSGLEHWTTEKLMNKHKSVQTNPAIANVFFRCGFIEAWGRGIETICKECDKSGNSYPVFEISDCGFMVRFDALKSSIISPSVANVPQDVPQNVLQNVPQELSDLQKRILAFVKSNPQISRAKIAELCEVNVKTIARNLSTMRTMVRFEGRGHNGKWIILSNVPQDVPQNVPQDVPQDLPQDVPQDVPLNVLQNVPQELSDLQKRILAFVKSNPQISRAKIAKLCGVSIKTIARNLSQMRTMVRFEGRGHNGKWVIFSTAPTSSGAVPHRSKPYET